MRHLLSSTEEGLDKSFIKMSDIRESAWNARSVTEDMRHLSAARLLDEITLRIKREARMELLLGPTGQVVPAIEASSLRVLEHYRAMGAIQDFELGSVSEEYGMNDETLRTVQVSIVPTVNLEKINISIGMR